MVWDSSLDSGDEFITITEVSTELKSAGQHYRVTDGTFQGYWFCELSTSAPFDNAMWSVNSDGSLCWRDGAAYFKRWDGNGFGDNNQFEIADNQNTLTDDNGNSVLYGTARVALPYFYVGE